jgi:hypothetical protein
MSFDINFFWEYSPDAHDTSEILNSLKPSFIANIGSINIASDNRQTIKNICTYCNDDTDNDDCYTDDFCPFAKDLHHSQWCYI